MRIALGAARVHIIRMVLGDTGRVVISGVVIGSLGSLATTRFVAGLLYGVEPHDPGILGLTALTLVTVGLGAAFIPARRATRVDPVAALRDE